MRKPTDESCLAHPSAHYCHPNSEEQTAGLTTSTRMILPGQEPASFHAPGDATVSVAGRTAP
jgi:hypothetical protein